MKTITIIGKARNSRGKLASKLLRKNERVPCVLYGGEENILFSVPEKHFKPLVYTKDAYLAQLEVSGKTFEAILQDVQFHPVSDKIIHADFYQVDQNKSITINVPVELTGRSPGVISGGSLRFVMRKLRIKAIPKDIPEVIKLDISEMKIGSKISVSELENKNYQFLHPPNSVVVAVKMSRVAISTEEEQGEEEPQEQESTEQTAT